MTTSRRWILKTVLTLACLPAFAAREGLEPHLVLPLATELTVEQTLCLTRIEAAEARFCAGETDADGRASLEIFLRGDYRGEFGVREDRGAMLDGAYDRLTIACGIDPGLGRDEFRGIVGTPLSSLGTEALRERTRSVLENTSRYYFDMGFFDYLKSGLDLPPRSRCVAQPFLGM